jgi:hypothetical protein
LKEKQIKMMLLKFRGPDTKIKEVKENKVVDVTLKVSKPRTPL